MKITSKELRNAWIKFYESKGHVNIGGVSLIGDGTTGVMFNVAGMQPSPIKDTAPILTCPLLS